MKRDTAKTMRWRAKKGTLYTTWVSMRERCNTATNHAFRYYGGKGVSVCKRWDSFDDFATDMGEKPTPLHTLDRIDTHGNYEPSNCRWATRKEQARNKTTSKLCPCDIVCIRILRASGFKITELDDMFGVANTMISRIALRQSWTEIDWANCGGKHDGR